MIDVAARVTEEGSISDNASKCYPKNPYIRNGKFAAAYLFCLRKGWRRIGKLFGLILGCDIGCTVPARLFMPHPLGIVADTNCVIGEDVVLMQQVTLGVRYPYGRYADEFRDPVLKRGVFVGAGARILGPVTIGEWAVIGANAVITKDVAPYAIIVGHNQVISITSDELERRIMAGEI